MPINPADVKRGLDGLIADLRRRRTVVESHTTSGRNDAHRRLEHLDEMFAFPAAAASALENVGPFVTALLEQVNTPDAGDAVMSPPFFRGVYLTSALRTGEALDAELSKAFGTDLRPATRRAASDRAFFIRDLLLEKIVPEAGMVAPLSAIPAVAGRRARLITAAAGIAAAVVLGGSLVGYRTTVARTRADRDFWGQLAAVPADKLPAQLALFDPAGNYRGAAALATYERSTQLASIDTASPLLPASARINRDRVAAHANLFRQFALAPALVPGPYAATSVPPAQATAAVMAVLADTRGVGPVPVATLRSDAAALVPLRANAADRNRVLALLAAGVPAVSSTGEPATVVQLAADQRRRIADAVLTWVSADLADRRAATTAVVSRATAAAADTLALAGALDDFEQGVRAASVPEDLVEPLRIFDRAVAAHPAAGDTLAVDRRALSAAVAPPPELKMIGSAISSLSDGDDAVRRKLAAMVLEHGDFLATQSLVLNTGSRSTHTADPTVATVREQQRIVDDHRTPLIMARVSWFHTAATQARDAVTTATTRPATAGPPAVVLPPLLRQLVDDDAARRQSFSPLSAVDTVADRDCDRQCADHLADVCDRAARDAVWTYVRPAATDVLWPIDAPPAVTLSAWVSDQSAVEAALQDQPPSKGVPAAKRWVDASHAQLEQVANHQLATWRVAAAFDGVVKLPVKTWADVATVAYAKPATRPTIDRAGLAVLRQQSLFPAVKQSADAWAAELDAPPVAAGPAREVRSFLSDYGFGRDTMDAVRARLAGDPEAMARLAKLSASPLDPYWRDTLVASVGLLADAARRQTLAALRDLHVAVADRYPLVAEGTGSWDGVIDDRLKAGLVLAEASSDPMARAIQGTDALTPAWQAYLARLRRVIAFAQRPPTNWTVTFHMTDGATEAWAVVAAGVATVGEPENWHRFVQHRVVSVSWPMIASGIAVRVSRDAAGTEPVPVLGELGRPWAAYRMAVSASPVVDDVSHVRAELDRHGDPATAAVPMNAPPGP